MKIELRVFRSPNDSFTWNFTGYKFDIGRGPDCQLTIDGESSHLVSWRHAEIELHPDDCVVSDQRSTNGTYVDGVRISHPTRVRAGQEIWLGDRGPRLRVMWIGPQEQVVAAAAPFVPQQVAPPAATSASHTPPPYQPSPGHPTPGSSPADPTLQILAAMSHQQAQTTRMIALVAGVFVAVLLVGTLAAFWLTRGRSTDTVVKVDAPNHTSVKVEPVPTKIAPPVVPPPIASPPQAEPKKIEPPPVVKPPEPAPPVDPWQTAQANLGEGLFLVVIENPKTAAMWGLANAIEVNNTRLLTSGMIGLEVAKFLKRGWNVYALRNSLSERVPIASVLVHAGAQNDKPEEQIYFDLSLLVTAQPLTGKPAKLATPADIAALENGLPLASLAIEYGEDPLDRFQKLDPQVSSNKVFAMTQLSPEPGAPQLMCLRGKFTAKPVGCPIFNDQGAVVGLYSDASPLEGDENKNLQVHYAPLLLSNVIQLGASGQPGQVWVTPVVPDKPAAKSTPTKKN